MLKKEKVMKNEYLKKLLKVFVESGKTPDEFLNNYNQSFLSKSYIDLATSIGIDCFNEIKKVNISKERLLGGLRRGDYVLFKEMLVYYLYYKDNFTLMQIADYFGNRHGNILYLRDKASFSKDNYDWYNDLYKKLSRCLEKKLQDEIKARRTN